MAVYTPPTENLPIFNAAVFINPPSIDTAFLNANYLKFPTAQGTENFSLINVNGGINQTDSNYVNTTISTGATTQISGGALTNTAGVLNAQLSTTLLVKDNAGGFNHYISMNNNSINYVNDTGGADQLIISSTFTDNPILIQSSTSTGGATGIKLNTTTLGDDIIIETTSNAAPQVPSNIQLITSGSTGAELGAQSSIILDTDNVFVRNGSLVIQNDRNNFTTGLFIDEPTASNFQARNNTGGSLTLGTTINNIVLSPTATTISIPLTPTYSGSSPTATQIGYTINTNLSGTASLPPTANVSANMNAGIVIPNGVWFVSIVAEINYSVVGATTSYFALSLSQSTGNMDAQNRMDFVAGLRTGDIFFNFPLIVNSTGGTYFIVGVQQGGTKTLDSLNYKITRIA